VVRWSRGQALSQGLSASNRVHPSSCIDHLLISTVRGLGGGGGIKGRVSKGGYTGQTVGRREYRDCSHEAVAVKMD
jgi:hypothetical protein